MTFIRRTSINRAAHIKPETIAYIRGELDSPDYPVGMSRFWHGFSLWDGHVHAKWQYSVEQAAEALGVDVEALRRRYGVKPRRSAR